MKLFKPKFYNKSRFCLRFILHSFGLKSVWLKTQRHTLCAWGDNMCAQFMTIIKHTFAFIIPTSKITYELNYSYWVVVYAIHAASCFWCSAMSEAFANCCQTSQQSGSTFHVPSEARQKSLSYLRRYPNKYTLYYMLYDKYLFMLNVDTFNATT